VEVFLSERISFEENERIFERKKLDVKEEHCELSKSKNSQYLLTPSCIFQFFKERFRQLTAQRARMNTS